MLPKTISPMLAVTAPAAFDSEAYFFEVKWDGIRCLAFVNVDKRQVRLQSRELIDITAQFPELECLASLPEGTVLDGELVIVDNGKPSLARMQKRMQLADRNRITLLRQHWPVVYMVFDLLYLRGKPVMAHSLLDRNRPAEPSYGEG